MDLRLLEDLDTESTTHICLPVVAFSEQAALAEVTTRGAGFLAWIAMILNAALGLLFVV